VALPTLSLVIVTYCREAAVLEQLESLLPHRDQFHEVIIVDNHPEGGLGASATGIWGAGIRILPQTENLGAVARTKGILASTGDIVLTLDDDVRLADPTELVYLRSLYQSGAPIGCVNFRILYGDGKTLDLSDWCHPRDPDVYHRQLFETNYISEGACALDGRLVREIGAYPLDLFIGQEGIDLAARIMNRKFGILYLPSVTVLHGVASEGRTTGRQFYFNTRNIYWIALRLYPFPLLVRTLTREWLTLLAMSIVRGRFRFFIKGVVDGILKTSTLIRDRKPISPAAAYRIQRLNSLKPSIWRRLRRIRSSKTLD